MCAMRVWSDDDQHQLCSLNGGSRLRRPVALRRRLLERVVDDFERRIGQSRLTDDEILEYAIVIKVETDEDPFFFLTWLSS